MTNNTKTPLRELLRTMKYGSRLYVRIAEYVYESNPPMVAYADWHAAHNPSGGYMLEIQKRSITPGFGGNSRGRFWVNSTPGKWLPGTMLFNMLCGLVDTSAITEKPT